MWSFEESWFGKLAAASALRLVGAYCIETLKRDRIWLDVLEDNGRARHVYEKHGFTQFGETTHDNRTLVLYELRQTRDS